MYYRRILLVVIQQLRGPNDTHFDHLSTPLEWTIVDNLHTTLCSRDQAWTSY